MKIILLGYCFIILLGTVLLRLPAAVRDGSEQSVLTAFFTATSSTWCDRSRQSRYLHNWTLFGPGGDPRADSNRRDRIHDNLYFCAFTDKEKHRARIAISDAELYFRAAAGRDRPYDEIYFSGDSTHRRNRCAAACVLAFCPLLGSEGAYVFRYFTVFPHSVMPDLI